MNEKYASSSEVFIVLSDYILKELEESEDFTKHLFHYMIQSDTISGAQVCEILMEQGAVSVSDEEAGRLVSGEESAMTFMMNRIKRME